LPDAPRLAIHNSRVVSPSAEGRWLLRGVTSNERYVTNEERQLLAAKQPPLGRPEAVLAALIPIHKSDAWWSLTQEDRREIFETSSRHIKTGLTVLPAVARRLHHSRDLGEPFDFLTWFEYAPGDSVVFEELVLALRATEEWKYVDREVDIRAVRDSTA
jgi:chlorite dismutase